MESSVGKCASEYGYGGLECECGNKIQFVESPSIWNNEVIKCECGKKYLMLMSGYAYPLCFAHGEWEHYYGPVAQRIEHKGRRKNSVLW